MEGGRGAAVAARLRAAGCVYAEEEAAVLLEAAEDDADLARLVAARSAGAPLEHVVGWAEFLGRRVAVDPGVFVPRARTGLLALRAAALARPGAVVVDACCGSGAVGVAVLARVPGVRLHACDADPLAVACAARNLAPLGGRVHRGDLLDALPPALRGRVDVVVANAPYVPTAELPLMPAEARDHEPREALDGGPDGVALHRRIAAAAPAWLRDGGAVLVETGRRQAALTAAAFHDRGFRTEVHHSEERDATVVTARRPAAGPARGPARPTGPPPPPSAAAPS